MSSAGLHVYKRSRTASTVILFIFAMCVGRSTIAAEQWDNVFRFQHILAERGDIEAQYLLGEMYEEGRGITRDLARARLWYERSAAQGHSGARQRLDHFGAQKNPS